MAEPDPKQVIIEYISQPLGQLEPTPPTPLGVPLTGPQPMTRSGGGLAAKASTVQFLHERRLPDCQVHFVSFENETGQQHHWLCCIKASDSGHWQFAGGASVPGVETMPKRGYPWVNLAGGWGADLFWAGGRVLDTGLDVLRVRLFSADGSELEDAVQDGLVLFLANQGMQRPFRAELFDRLGKLVGTHQVLPWKSPEQSI